MNVGFILKHFFLQKAPPIGDGYTAIQLYCHSMYHIQSNFTMKDVLYQIAFLYKLMNPICGVISRLPFQEWNVTKASMEDDETERRV